MRFTRLISVSQSRSGSADVMARKERRKAFKNTYDQMHKKTMQQKKTVDNRAKENEIRRVKRIYEKHQHMDKDAANVRAEKFVDQAYKCCVSSDPHDVQAAGESGCSFVWGPDRKTKLYYPSDLDDDANLYPKTKMELQKWWKNFYTMQRKKIMKEQELKRRQMFG